MSLPILVTCPTCRGGGELVDCPLTCDGSHIADTPYRCSDCDGEGDIRLDVGASEGHPVMSCLCPSCVVRTAWFRELESVAS